MLFDYPGYNLIILKDLLHITYRGIWRHDATVGVFGSKGATEQAVQPTYSDIFPYCMTFY